MAKPLFIDFLPLLKFFQKAVVFHPEKKGLFLAVRRPKDDPRRPGCWDLPGGNVAFGERHDQAIIREIEEETGLAVRRETLKPLYIESNFLEKRDKYILFIGYAAAARNDKVVLSEEHIQFKWVGKSEFLALESADFLERMVEAIGN